MLCRLAPAETGGSSFALSLSLPLSLPLSLSLSLSLTHSHSDSDSDSLSLSLPLSRALWVSGLITSQRYRYPRALWAARARLRGGSCKSSFKRKRVLPRLACPYDTLLKLSTLHPAPCALRPAPYTLHPTPHTLHPTPLGVSAGLCPDDIARKRHAVPSRAERDGPKRRLQCCRAKKEKLSTIERLVPER